MLNANISSSVSVVILANSVKHGKNCIAGKDLNTNQWIRFVADETGKELSSYQSKASNPYGSYPVKPLQKIEAGIGKHAPLINQPENYLIDGSEWKQNYKISKNQLHNFLDNPDDLWGNGNKVNCTDIKSGYKKIQQSLYLVKVDRLKLSTNSYGKRRAAFEYNGIKYDLPATDRNFDQITDNNESLEGVLCLSLGEPYNGSCYKIVAGIY